MPAREPIRFLGEAVRDGGLLIGTTEVTWVVMIAAITTERGDYDQHLSLFF